jgi:thioredoxin-related protein
MLMNKKLLITLAVTSLSLVACSKEGDFKKAINVNLSQDPLRV